MRYQRLYLGLNRYICVKVIDIPGEKDEAYFLDYSGMDMNGTTIMISSQVGTPLLCARDGGLCG